MVVQGTGGWKLEFRFSAISRTSTNDQEMFAFASGKLEIFPLELLLLS